VVLLLRPEGEKEGMEREERGKKERSKKERGGEGREMEPLN